MKHFGDIAFTDTVKQEQERIGSRAMYAGMTARPTPDGLGPAEAAFIQARDSFYMATVSETGWPYVQHRGGPKGFVKMLSPTKIGFADYRGNKQLVSTGNLRKADRTSLFMMDYPNRRRLKLLAHTRVLEASEDPELAEALADPGSGPVERLFLMDVEAFDWNCPQYITPRFTEVELQSRVQPVIEEISYLRGENKALRERLGEG
ncbi:MAG: pyridoxamine 5'-phosphate oxidase family protein [Pseudomonadota bacterium]